MYITDYEKIAIAPKSKKLKLKTEIYPSVECGYRFHKKEFV